MTTVTARGGWQARLDLATDPLAPWSAALWRAEDLADRYPAYLHAMHGVVRASVPLMEAAIRRCAQLTHDDTAEPLARYLARHVTEELDHDRWLLADLDVAGGDADATARAQPGVAVARLAGAQYYWMLHHHPVCLLGYMAVLEGTAPPAWLPAVLVARTGLPAGAFRTLRHHAVLDTAHSAEIVELLDRLDLTPRLRSAVGASALATADAFGALLADLVRRPTHPEGPRS